MTFTHKSGRKSNYTNYQIAKFLGPAAIPTLKFFLLLAISSSENVTIAFHEMAALLIPQQPFPKACSVLKVQGH